MQRAFAAQDGKTGWIIWPLSDIERTAIKDYLLVWCTPTPTDPLKLPLGAYTVTAKKYKVSPRTVKRIWYQYCESAAESRNG